MRTRPGQLALVLTVLSVLACAKGGAADAEINCGDGLDDDADGFADCDDAECQGDPACDDEEEDEDCDNGDDDDGDDDVDCDDSDCDDDPDCDENPDDEDCDNGDDDDDDGDIDCEDIDCASDPACTSEDEDCDNGRDDDDDGDVDCDDSDCFGSIDCETSTGDFVATSMFIGGSFGYDASTGKIVTAYDAAGTALEPTILFTFNTDAYDGTDDSQTCSLVATWLGAAMTPKVFSHTYGTQVGITMNLTSSSVALDTDCDAKGWDETTMGGSAEDLVLSFFTTASVGVGEWNPDVYGDFVGLVSSADLPTYMGGGHGPNAADGSTYYASNYGFGYAMNGSHDLINDGTSYTTLVGEDILDVWADRLPTGYYVSGQFYGYGL